MPHSEHLCPHINQLTDEREGTIVCTTCGLVLEDKLFIASNNNKDTDATTITQKINDILDKLNFPKYFTVDILKKYLNSEPKKYLLEYSIYLTLYESGFPISIKDIANVTGISDSKIYSLQANDQSINLRPEDLLEKYCVLLELNYNTYSLIKKELPSSIQTGHNPLTVIASTIYLYCKNNKIKLSMKQIASVINISTVSIQRYIKKC